MMSTGRLLRRVAFLCSQKEQAFVEETVSIAEFMRIIQKLPSDQPRIQPGVWYTTQKQHWLGWLSEYDGPGAYGRRSGQNRDAKFA